MSRERSRSREKVNQYKQQKGQHLNKRYQTNNFQRGSSSDGKLVQKSSSVPKQYPQGYLGINPAQVRKSLSPNRMNQQENRVSSNINLNKNRPQKLSFKQMSNKKVQTIQQLAQFLRSCKKPFASSEAAVLQTILQKLGSKYSFQQIYQVFVYFFIHSSTLDENIYKVFYSLISRINTADASDLDYLPRFYDTLIRTTLKTVFQQFKVNVDRIQGVHPSTYFLISNQTRQLLINKSLYSSSAQQSLGCSIRSGLTLIRKSMQRQKVNDHKMSQSVHPIRQILRVFRQIVKSIFKRVFVEGKTVKQGQKMREKQNTLHLLMISQLFLVIHFKYKHHISLQFEQTLNQMTILKMKIAQIRQQINSNEQLPSKQQVLELEDKKQKDIKESQSQILKSLAQSYEKLNKQHEKNYFFLLFVLNLSAYNRNQADQSDWNILGFYLQPLLEQYRKSSEFLEEKIQSNQIKAEKLIFFSSITKNFGIIKNTNKPCNTQLPSQLADFVHNSHFNILSRSIKYTIQLSRNKIVTKSQQKEKDQYFLKIFTALSPFQTSYEKINHLRDINIKVNSFKKLDSVLDEKTTNHVLRELSFIIQPSIKIQTLKLLNLKHKIGLNQKIVPCDDTRIKLSQNGQMNNQVRVIEIQNIQQPRSNQKQITDLLLWLTKLKSQIESLLYLKILSSIYLLYKQIKLELVYCQYLKLKELNIARNDKMAENVYTEKGDTASIMSSDNIKLEIRKIDTICEIQNQILKSIFNQIEESPADPQDIDPVLLNLHHITSFKRRSLGSRSLNLQILNFIISQQEQEQANKLRESIEQKIEKRVKRMHYQTYKSMQEKDFQNKIKDNIHSMINKAKKYITLCFQKDRVAISQLQKTLNRKKLQLLKKNIIQSQLQQILFSIIKLHTQNKQVNQSSFNNSLRVQSFVQHLILKLFSLYSLVNTNKYFFSEPYKISGQNQSKGHNQNFIEVRKALANKLNIKLVERQVSSFQLNSRDAKDRDNEVEGLFSDILAKIYFTFMATYDQLKHDITKVNQNEQHSSFNSHLEDILVVKIKKAISLFYDKMNQNMLHFYILNKKTFILRCLIITFYKVKSLSQIIILHYDSFHKVGPQYKSTPMFSFVKQIFFNIQNQNMLEGYVNFLALKDRTYLKNQLLSCKDSFGNQYETKKRLQEIVSFL